MRLEQLQYFVEISLSKSITTAADNLFISQSALSRSVKALEEELGVLLLSRTVDGVKLTEEGALLLLFMKDILFKVDALQEASRQLNGTNDNRTLNGCLNIATIPVIADMLVFPALEDMNELYPNVNVYVDVKNFDGFKNIVLPKEIDILILVNINCILDGHLKNTNLHVELLFYDNFSIVVGKEHPLAEKHVVTLDEALSYKLVAHYNGQDLNEFYKNFSKRQKPLEIILKSNNHKIIKQALKNDGGVLITNNFLIKNDFINDEDLVVVPQKYSRGEYVALYDEESSKIQMIQAFINVLKSFRMRG